MSFQDFYGAVTGIGQSFSDAYEGAQRKNVLSKLGEAIQGGNYGAGASIAFGAGDLPTGVGLLKLADAQQQRKLTLDADNAFASGLSGAFGVGGPVGSNVGAAMGGGRSSPVPSFLDTDGPSGTFVKNLFTRESNNRTDAQAPTSSARGLGQFTTDTWNGVARRYPGLNLTPAGGGQDGRTDPDQMLRATNALTGEHTDALRGSNLPVNDATLYSLHFLGAGGGRRFVAGTMSNPDAPAVNYVSPPAAAANRNVFYGRDGTPKTAGQVMGDFARSFGGGGGGGAPAAPGRPPQVASADPGFLPDFSTMPSPLSRPQAPPPQARPQQPVAFADDEAQTQALEQRMGMVPPQQRVAGYDPRSDLPVAGAQEASGYFVPPRPQQAIPGSVAALPPGLSGAEPRPPGTPGSPQPQRQFPAPSDPAQVGGPRAIPPTSLMPSSSNPASPVPQSYGGGGSVPGGRVMTMPGAEPLPGSQGDAAPASPADRYARARLDAVAQSPLGERIPFLLKAIGNSNLSDGNREVAKLLYKQAVDESTMPPAIKEFRIARGLGYTQANTPAEYAREKERNPGQDLTGQIDARASAAARYGLQPGTPEYRSYTLTGKEPTEKDEGAKITSQIEARKAAAPGLGLQEGTPAWRSYVASGKVGADRDMSVTEKKAIETADNAVISAQSSIGLLEQAKKISADAYGGPYAKMRGNFMSAFGSDRGQATQELDNLVTTNALTNLKSIFGGNPTEGERKIMLDVAGSSDLPHALRVKVYDRAIQAAQLRMQQNLDRRNQIQDGTYYRPGGGVPVPGRQQAPDDAAPDRRSLPAPSPSNRPGAVAPGDRFGQLVGSGMSEAQAYARMHQEGY